MIKLFKSRATALLILCFLSAPLCHAETSTYTGDTAAVSSGTHQVVVYYLYFYPRCETCINMELFAEEALETTFADELENGSLEWHAFNIDSPEHHHFWEDFRLDTKALVVAELVDGRIVRWKNCERIWDLAETKPDYLEYVREEVKAYLRRE